MICCCWGVDGFARGSRCLPKCSIIYGRICLDAPNNLLYSLLMYKRLLILVVVCLAVLISQQPENVEAQSAADIMQQVNLFRVKNGLPALQYNSALSSAAQNQANYMAEYQVFSSHTGYGGSTPQSRANAAGYGGRVTENIVGGTNLTAPKGLTWWVNSPVHYNTLITTQYTEAGTGYAVAGDIHYYVLVVGTPGSGPPPPSNPTQNDPAPLFITPITLAEPNEDGSIVHTMQDGQALWTLAAHYEVPLSDLLWFNNLKEDSFVNPGDEIIIRLADGASPPPTPTPPTTHIVQDGQSLWSIAALYNVKIGDIYLFNNLNENSFLQPGDEVKVRLAPGELPPPTPTPVVEHVVQSGQTLWDIALTYGLNLDQLLALNGIDQNTLLQPGDVLRVRELPTPIPIPPTFTPAPIEQETTIPPTATIQPTMTATAVSLAMVEGVETAVPEVPQVDEAHTNRSPLFMGIGLLIVGLLALGGAGVLYLRGQDPYEIG